MPQSSSNSICVYGTDVAAGPPILTTGVVLYPEPAFVTLTVFACPVPSITTSAVAVLATTDDIEAFAVE